MSTINADKLTEMSAEPIEKKKWFSGVFKRLLKNPLAIAGAVILLILILLAVFADVIAPYPYEEMHLTNKFALPSWEHLMVTDAY